VIFCKKGEKVQVDAQGNKTYKAPDVGKGPIDAKADIYSLRIILFMLLHPHNI
jgi:hypothetical protein